MTYTLTITATSATIRKGRCGVRRTLNPDLIGAYASLYALHGEAVLPRIWDDIIGHPPAKGEAIPARNASRTLSVAYPPTGCASVILDQGPTLQRGVQRRMPLRATGCETQYRSKDYYLK